jgi:t-SNARE complex subunit (syntaxin)
MEAGARALQELTERNAALARSLARLAAWSSSSAVQIDEKRRRLREDLDAAMRLAKEVGPVLNEAPTSAALTDIERRKRSKLKSKLEKELRKTKTLVAEMSRTEQRWLKSIDVAQKQQQQKKVRQRVWWPGTRLILVQDECKQEETFVEAASAPLLAQEQVEIDMASEMALRAEQNENEIRIIERDVAELNDMFQDMSFLVEQQQESIDCIEDNIASTATYTRRGYEEVEKVAPAPLPLVRAPSLIAATGPGISAALAFAFLQAPPASTCRRHHRRTRRSRHNSFMRIQRNGLQSLHASATRRERDW